MAYPVPLFARRVCVIALALAAPALLGGADTPTTPPRPPLPVAVATIVARYPHDTNAFTEGLLIDRGALYESTGYERSSFIKRIDLETGKVLQSTQLPSSVFGEGIVIWGNEILNVVWHGGQGQRRSLKDFRVTGKFTYTGEGWGMTHDTHNIILSDGTPVLRFLSPRTMKVVRRLTVTANGRPLPRLNELEYVKGAILANVWMTGAIVKIDPTTGHVTQVIDLTQLIADAHPRDPEAVPNGIAYDEAHDRLFVTGKYWPYIYQVALQQPPVSAKPDDGSLRQGR